MRVLGIDPGLNTTGYGVIEFAKREPRLVEAGVVRGKSGATLAERVREIYAGVADVIATLSRKCSPSKSSIRITIGRRPRS